MNGLSRAIADVFVLLEGEARRIGRKASQPVVTSLTMVLVGLGVVAGAGLMITAGFIALAVALNVAWAALITGAVVMTISLAVIAMLQVRRRMRL